MIITSVIMVLLFVIFGLASLKQMNELGELTSTLYDHPLTVSNAALKARAGVLSMHRSMKDVTMSRSEAEIHTAMQAVKTEEVKVYRQLDLVKERILGAEGKNLVQETIEMFAGWKSIRIEVQDLALLGEKALASRITKGKGADYVAQLERKMADLNAYARNKADGFMVRAGEVQHGIVIQTIIFILCVAFISSLVSMVMIRSILSSLSSLGATMEQISSTGNLTMASAPGSNEISEMAGHFNGLVSRLKNQFWLRDGINELNRELSGDLTYDELVSRSINFISRHTGACSGALYSFDRLEKVAELKASYAFVDRKHLSNRFEAGQGIIGQVAVEMKPIHLKGITSEEAVGQTGTISEPPRSIYAVPLLYENTLYGILETAYFEDLDNLKKEFLDSTAVIIAASLYTSTQNQRIKELFDFSQQANKELEARQLELDATNEELQAQTEELQAQAEELKSQTVELERQRVRVFEADRLKSEFLSNMSHELRTPLNSILALSQLMINRGTGKNIDQEAEFLGVIERNGRHLLNLINDILDLSKIESGRMDLELEKLDPRQTIHAAVETIKPLADEKGLSIEVDDGASKEMLTDRDKIQQILINLLSNAVKFTEQGSVKLTVAATDNMIAFTVSDSGIGISEEDLPKIFDQFRQADGSTTRRFDGTGLGLAICQKLANLLGGEITVKSNVGLGSVFTLSLPLMSGEPAKLDAFTASPPIPVPAPASLKRTVLVIDDDPVVRDLIVTYLKESGYETSVANNGREGLRKIREIRPYAVTLDLLMPDLDGWDVLRQMKSSEDTADIPVIIVSIAEDQATGAAMGAAGYLVKPVDKKLLLDELDKLSLTSKISRILVVDDEPAVRVLLQDILGQTYYLVDTASGGEEALRKIEIDPPDAVILDLVMPDLDGFTVLKKLRETELFQDIPVIVLTSKDLTPEERSVLQKEVHRTILKGEMDKNRLLTDLDSSLKQLEKTRPVAKKEKPLLLVVEDNPTAALQIKTALEDNGFAVMPASGGAEALECVKRVVPDGIILDLMMPEIDGFQVLEKIRSTSWTRELPVLILTAKELTREDKGRLSHNNVQQLIQKGSLDRDELVARVRKLLDPEPQIIEVEPVEKVNITIAQSDHKILIVEDNPDNLMTITAILEDVGYGFLTARNGREAVDVAQKLKPNLILMDIQLPGMSGLEAAGLIKSDSTLSDIPIIALTAKAMRGDREQALEKGCDDYLAKPINPEDLVGKIRKWMS